MKIRSAVAAVTVVISSLSLAAPAQAWECNKMEACQQAVMTACMTVYTVTGEQNCM